MHEAIAQAGGLSDVSAVSVAAQQHGMVCLDRAGAVVRPALLWNDLRSAEAATDLVAELGAVDVGTSRRQRTGRVVHRHETALVRPSRAGAAARTESVCLPHDWLTWKLRGSTDPASITTDRGDASGTGYWSPAHDCYREDVIQAAFGRVQRVPKVLGPADGRQAHRDGVVIGPGTGDNAGAALGIGASPGDVVVSVGTSGTIFSVTAAPAADSTGTVAGFADATGRFLPLVCTLNASRVLDAAARMLGVDLDELSASR